MFSYLDRETGEVHFVSEESLSLSEAESEEIESLPVGKRKKPNWQSLSKAQTGISRSLVDSR